MGRNDLDVAFEVASGFYHLQFLCGVTCNNKKQAADVLKFVKSITIKNYVYLFNA